MKRIVKSIILKSIGFFPESLHNAIKVRVLKNLPQYRGKKQIKNELEELYERQTGESIDLDNVKTFNEKIQWLKIYWKNNELARVVDKCEFKKYIAEKIGDGYTVPMYGAWKNVKDIKWKELPDSFVLKSNCCSDGNCIKIIKSKNEVDSKELKKELREWLNPYKTLVNLIVVHIGT